MKSNTATWNREDRDLLVELRTTLSSVQNDIKEIKDGTSAKLSFLETDKLSRSEAVRLSTENLSQHTDFTERIARNDKRLTELEDGKIEWRTSIRASLVVGGILQFLVTTGLVVYFHYH